MVVEVDLTGEDMWEIHEIYNSAERQHHRAMCKEIKIKSQKIMDAMGKMLSAYAAKQDFYEVDDIKIGLDDYRTK